MRVVYLVFSPLFTMPTSQQSQRHWACGHHLHAHLLPQSASESKARLPPDTANVPYRQDDNPYTRHEAAAEEPTSENVKGLAGSAVTASAAAAVVAAAAAAAVAAAAAAAVVAAFAAVPAVPAAASAVVAAADAGHPASVSPAAAAAGQRFLDGRHKALAAANE